MLYVFEAILAISWATTAASIIELDDDSEIKNIFNVRRKPMHEEPEPEESIIVRQPIIGQDSESNYENLLEGIRDQPKNCFYSSTGDKNQFFDIQSQPCSIPETNFPLSETSFFKNQLHKSYATPDQTEFTIPRQNLFQETLISDRIPLPAGIGGFDEDTKKQLTEAVFSCDRSAPDGIHFGDGTFNIANPNILSEEMKAPTKTLTEFQYPTPNEELQDVKPLSMVTDSYDMEWARACKQKLRQNERIYTQDLMTSDGRNDYNQKRSSPYEWEPIDTSQLEEELRNLRRSDT